jgi:hypothetical protein
VKDGSDDQVEEPFIFTNRFFSLITEKGMGLFLQVVERALSLIIDPVSDVRETEPAFLILFKDLLKKDLGAEKPLHDL